MEKSKPIIDIITTTSIILALLGSFFGAGYGFMEWVDKRYINSDRFLAVTARTTIAIYDQRIVDLSHQEKFLLEFRSTDKDGIADIRKQIKEIKEHRKYFLTTGHYPIGDDIIINQRVIIKQFK